MSKDEPRKILRENDLHNYDGLQKSLRAKLIKQGAYPVPFRLSDGGRAKAWYADEIAAWQHTRAAEHRLAAKDDNRQVPSRPRIRSRKHVRGGVAS